MMLLASVYYTYLLFNVYSDHWYVHVLYIIYVEVDNVHMYYCYYCIIADHTS